MIKGIWDFIRGRGYINARAKIARFMVAWAEANPGWNVTEEMVILYVPDWVRPHVPKALRDLERRCLICRVGFKAERKGDE